MGPRAKVSARAAQETSLELIGLIIVLVVLDPLYEYVRRHWMGEQAADYVPPHRAFQYLAFLTPALTLLTTAVALAPHLHNWGALMFLAFFTLWAATIGRYFYNRAHGRPAWLPRVGLVGREDPRYENDLYDLLAMLMAVVLVLAPVFMKLIPALNAD
jgi:hypothetical protein